MPFKDAPTRKQHQRPKTQKSLHEPLPPAPERVSEDFDATPEPMEFETSPATSYRQEVNGAAKEAVDWRDKRKFRVSRAPVDPYRQALAKLSEQGLGQGWQDIEQNATRLMAQHDAGEVDLDPAVLVNIKTLLALMHQRDQQLR